MKKYEPGKIESKWPRTTSVRGKQTYNPAVIELKWQKRWIKRKIFQPDLRKAKKPFYNLMMFPYPSGEGLHVGNMYAFTGADIYGRFKRMQGFDVFEPIGLDGFGIHSENYALSVGEHPAKLAQKTEKNFYRQLHATGNAYSWNNTLETYDPDYYKWTQWIFVQMFKKGLAYRKKAPVNWCPSCKTTLSDEQVIAGRCERCQTEVEERELEQWFFRITDYAERLLKNLDWIDWSQKVKIAQRNWIGKSEGLEIQFPITIRQLADQSPITAFTTRPDTLFGATFMVLAPESPLIDKITASGKKQAVKKYVEQAKKKTEFERISEKRAKTGVFTGSYCINPINNKKIPIWVADYVVMGYGTGAIMAVPAHDQRDWEFAQEHKLPIKRVIMGDTSDGGRLNPPAGGGSHDSSEVNGAFEDYGILINSGKFNGLTSKKAIQKISDLAEKEGWGKRKVQYRLRDWCVSRQRYWGPPIPMINCPKCGWVSVPEKDLPVLLPDVEDWRPKGSGKSPLANIKEFVNTSCPECGGAARRETDVSDTFLDSAWYFLRYPSTRSTRSGQLPFDPEITKRWLPVEMYIGGAEHAVLHLMYSRFLWMCFYDWGLFDFSARGGPASGWEEPYKKFRAHGLLIAEGAKMSKSRGNIVVPDEYIAKYGADTLRCYLMFLGPFIQGGDFRDTGIAGMWRFLSRVWRLANIRINSDNSNSDLIRIQHQTIKKVTEDIENLRYNTALAALMEYVNYLSDHQLLITNHSLEILVLLLAPFAPHLAEELWQQLKDTSEVGECPPARWSIHQQAWPKYEERLIKEETVTVVVQVNGKVRGQIELKPQTSNLKPEVEKLAKKEKNVAKYLQDKKIKKTIFVPGRLINFVV